MKLWPGLVWRVLKDIRVAWFPLQGAEGQKGSLVSGEGHQNDVENSPGGW